MNIYIYMYLIISLFIYWRNIELDINWEIRNLLGVGGEDYDLVDSVVKKIGFN